MKHRPRFQTSNESGASMIEVLVSILLVSVGLLGVAGLAGATFSYNKVAQVRLIGISLVNDLADRARINVYGYDRGSYDIELTADIAATETKVPIGNLDLDPAEPINANTIADGLAAADIDQFLRNVSDRLPQGDAVVTSRPGATIRDLDVWLLWKEPKASGDADNDRGDLSLFNSAANNCPGSLTPAEQADYSCMYFKVGL